MGYLRKIGLFLFTLCLCGCISNSKRASQEPIKILIVDGFSNHDWQHTTRCIQAILDQSGGFDISVSTYPAEGTAEQIDKWNPHFQDYDVVIQTCNNIKNKVQWSRRIEESLATYVENGGGLFVFHSANNAFPHWEEYNRMIGLGWRGKDFGWAITVDDEGKVVRIPAGEGEKTSHGKRVDALLTRLGDHPIHTGLPQQWVAADIEIYRFARGPAENLTVLSYAQDEKTGLNFPIEWTTAYGKGCVYNSTFGHVWKTQKEPKGICCAGFQTILPRALQWLAGRDIDISVPDDFPSQNAAQLRPYPLAE
jgi:type 1 glutamine amidotransferase